MSGIWGQLPHVVPRPALDRDQLAAAASVSPPCPALTRRSLALTVVAASPSWREVASDQKQQPGQLRERLQWEEEH